MQCQLDPSGKSSGEKGGTIENVVNTTIVSVGPRASQCKTSVTMSKTLWSSPSKIEEKKIKVKVVKK